MAAPKYTAQYRHLRAHFGEPLPPPLEPSISEVRSQAYSLATIAQQLWMKGIEHEDCAKGLRYLARASDLFAKSCSLGQRALQMEEES